jgi:hypothetical protein
MTALVKCIVAEKPISVMACIERQEFSRCFCPQAAIAIREVGEENDAVAGEQLDVGARKKKMRVRLEVLKDRATGFFRLPSEKRFYGPALEKKLAGSLPTQIQGDAEAKPDIGPSGKMAALLGGDPAPSLALKPTCEWPGGCTTPLAVNNLSKLCQEHRSKVSSRKRADLVPKIARAAGTARHAIESSPEDREDLHEERIAAQEIEPGAGEPTLAAAEELAIRASHLRQGGNIRQMARELGIARLTLHRKLDALGLRATDAGLRTCSGEGCTTKLSKKTRGDKCVPCLKNIKPGGGWAACANALCTRKTQKLVNKLCALCRQGKKHHLRQETKMPDGKPQLCAWSAERCTEVIKRPAANKSGLCRKHMLKKSGQERRASAKTTVKGTRTRTAISAAPGAVIGGLDLSTLTMEQLLACPGELRRRMQLLHEQLRAADFALAGEPLSGPAAAP